MSFERLFWIIKKQNAFQIQNKRTYEIKTIDLCPLTQMSALLIMTNVQLRQDIGKLSLPSRRSAAALMVPTSGAQKLILFENQAGYTLNFSSYFILGTVIL